MSSSYVWRKVRFPISFNRHLSSTKSDCGICFQDLSKKRTATLRCGHLLHRTCIVKFCESQCSETAQFFCPKCNENFACYVLDDRLQYLPEILPFGPAGQPSPNQLLTTLKTGVFESIITHYLVNTAAWLLQTSEDLRIASDSNECEEYIKDIIEERRKLLQRYNMLSNLQEEHFVMKNRVPEAVNRCESAVGEDEAVADGIRVVSTAEHADSNEETTCGICIDRIDSKRTVTLEPCRHKYHRTCVMRWFESTMTKGFPCCMCRKEATKIVGEDGAIVRHTYPFEMRLAQLLSGRKTVRGDPFEAVRRNKSKISKLVLELAQHKIFALKYKKNDSYLTDIDEEMEKIKMRSLALDAYHLSIVQNKETNVPLDRDEAFTGSGSTINASVALIDANVVPMNPTVMTAIADASGTEIATTELGADTTQRRNEDDQ